LPENLDIWLRKAAEKVDSGIIDEARERMGAAWNFKPVDQPPLIVSCPSPEPWPTFKYSETFYDRDKMLLSQLAGIYSHCLLRDGAMPCVRANYGVGIIPSGFGSETIVQREVDNMPWVKGPILSRDPPSVDDLKDPDPYKDGLMKETLETEEYFVKKLDGTGIRVYLCDTQGPLDIAYLLRGPKLLTDFYRHPDFVRDLLQRVSDVYVEFSELQKRLIGEPYDQGVHGAPNVWMDRGGARICEDVAVMLSPKIYRAFCRPFNEACLKPFGGGIPHFCCSLSSDGKHILDEILDNPCIKAFVFGGPAKFYDFGKTVAHFQEKHVCLIWSDGPAQNQTVEEWVENVARGLNEKTGVIFSISAESFEKAQKLIACFNKRFSK